MRYPDWVPPNPTASRWGNPDCDAGYHAAARVESRSWLAFWRKHVEWRCWNCDWVMTDEDAWPVLTEPA